MARIIRGSGNHKRTNAKNFIQTEAQARLDETVPAFNKQVENSLYVNAVEADYYSILNKIGRPCTCEKIEVKDEFYTTTGDTGDTTVNPIVPTPDNDSSAGISIQLQDDDLFGDGPAEKLYGETIIDVSGEETFVGDDDIPEYLYDDVEKKEGDVVYTETAMYGTNANCGICYRTGYQPGYTLYGSQRLVLTSLDINDMEGYHICPTDTPNSMQRQGPIKPHTFVEFKITVPKYFKTCRYSIRDNTKILMEAKLLYNGIPLRSDILKRFAGSELTFRVNSEKFTHVVIEFELNVPKLRVNLGAETQALDYNKREAIGDFPVVIPPSVKEVNNGDIIVVKDRRLVLKVINKERKITADKKQLEWVVQARVVQPTEAIKLIAKSLKIV